MREVTGRRMPKVLFNGSSCLALVQRFVIRPIDLCPVANIAVVLGVVFALLYVTMTDARAENVPDMLQRHEKEIRHLETEIDSIRKKIQEMERGKGSVSGSEVGETAVCSQSLKNLQGSHSVSSLTAWEPAGNTMRLGLIKADIYGVTFSSNARGLNGKFIAVGKVVEFKFRNCEISLGVYRYYTNKGVEIVDFYITFLE